MKDPFTYKITKNEKVMIYRCNKLVKIVKGSWAADFIRVCERLSQEKLQMRLARVTGNYKRGNEKPSQDSL